MKKCLIIYNPHSGRHELKKYLPEIAQLLNKKDYEVEIIATKYKGHATELVANTSSVDLVMSFGGDGTFNEVMTGNFQRKEKLLLTHIPVGTTNDIGSMLGYTKNILENVKLSLNGVIKEFDIGLINNHPFVYVAGFGKYTNISYETPRTLKQKIGQLAYIKEAIAAFFSKTKLYDITYEIDGNKYRGLFSLILISNANHIAGIKNVYKDVKLDDNLLEVVFCTIKKRKDILRSLYFLTMHGPSQVPGIYFYRTDNIKIQINQDDYKPWCIDGEKLEQSPNDKYKIEIAKKVKVLIPKKNTNKLFNKNT
jgi:YegS/Rv2252/BmrU family lipid kinase